MTTMRDSHRLFLQSFMSRSLLDAKEVKQLYKRSCDRNRETYPEAEEERRHRLIEFVGVINSHLRPLNMEIKKGVSENDGSNFYGLVNTAESQITRQSSDYTANELEFFKKVIESIVQSDNGLISSTDALNLVAKLDKRMTINDAQELLKKLEQHKWIELIEGQVALATRAILELDQYILEIYPGVAVPCNMCKKLCLRGQPCDGCDTRLHHHCASRFFLGQDEPKCPNAECGRPWSHRVTDRDETAPMEASQTKSATQQSSRKRKLRS